MSDGLVVRQGVWCARRRHISVVHETEACVSGKAHSYASDDAQICTLVFPDACTNTHTHTHPHTHLHPHTSTYTHTGTLMCTCAHAQAHKCTHIRLDTLIEEQKRKQGKRTAISVVPINVTTASMHTCCVAGTFGGIVELSHGPLMLGMRPCEFAFGKLTSCMCTGH